MPTLDPRPHLALGQLPRSTSAMSVRLPAGSAHAGVLLNPYARLMLMGLVASAAMLGLMYLSSYSVGHVYFSLPRAWMALMAGATLTLLVLGFMRPAYPNARANLAVASGCVALVVLALWALRSQPAVDDVAWMKSMIPRHSVAILASERAQLVDPRVRRLAGEIATTQRQQIAEMEDLVDDLYLHPLPPQP